MGIATYDSLCVDLDIRADSVADVERLGATVVDGESFGWTVMKDPEGGELCVFLTRPDTRRGLYELGVDCEDPTRIATRWAEVLGARSKDDDEHGWPYLDVSSPIPRATSSARSSSSAAGPG